MQLHCDLHAHSAFAGGARAGGKNETERRRKIIKRFKESALYSPLKGVNILGTGDIQFEPWLEFIENELIETKPGIYTYYPEDNISQKLIPSAYEYSIPDYILQTELIFTGVLPNSSYKKRVHMIILFPDIDSVKQLNDLLDQWEVAREKMARPFVVTETREELNRKIHAILDLDPLIEVIPAHVLTPEGVYGGNLRVNHMEDFFGTSADRFNAVETGLSADPDILGMIPELDNLTLISNADAHSAKLNRVGREFTTLDVHKLSYESIIRSIRQNKVIKTAEFHPTEGRYFLTGHREGRTRPGNHNKDQYCLFSPNHVPADDICPQCGGELTIGVLQRVQEIAQVQGTDRSIGDGPERNFVTMVPLIEIVAHALEMKTLTAKTVLNMYSRVLEITKTEVSLWMDNDTITDIRQSDLPQNLIDEILEVKKGNFSFYPGGYDGVYGELKIGKQIDYTDIKEINN